MNEYQISRVRVTASIKWTSRVESSRLKNGWVRVEYASIYIVLNINIFNIEYHAIIKIVESGQVDKKIVESSQICPLPNPIPEISQSTAFKLLEEFNKSQIVYILLLASMMIISFYSSSSTEVEYQGGYITSIHQTISRKNKR